MILTFHFHRVCFGPRDPADRSDRCWPILLKKLRIRGAAISLRRERTRVDPGLTCIQAHVRTLGQESQQSIHARVVRLVANKTAFLARGDKIGMAQGLEVKGQRVGWDVQAFRKSTGSEAFRGNLNEKPVHL
jgi:hypothetical protein